MYKLKFWMNTKNKIILSNYELYLLLIKIRNYELGLFDKIKKERYHQFNSKKELQTAIDEWCNSELYE